MFATKTKPIPASKLGAHLGRQGVQDWYELDNGEIAVRRQPLAEPARPDQLVVTKEEIEVGKYGDRLVHHRVFSAEKFPAGTFASISVPRAKRPRRVRTWDALGAVHQGREPARIQYAPGAASPLEGALRSAAGIEAAEPWIEIARDGAGLSVSGLVDWLAKRGIACEVARGRLVARSAKPIGVAEREVLTRAEALLAAFLIGSPLSCVLCDRTAVTVAWPSAPVCEEHLGH